MKVGFVNTGAEEVAESGEHNTQFIQTQKEIVIIWTIVAMCPIKKAYIK